MSRHWVRVPQLWLGLVLAAVGICATLRSELGVSPWDVLHAGVAERTGLGFGTVVQLVGAVVLFGSLFVGARPGFGTVCNMLGIGAVENVLLDTSVFAGVGDGPLVWRIVLLLAGVVTIGFSAALYIGSHYGPGPRDGLMVALHVRRRISIGWARTIVESLALVVGVVAGGPVGVGTLAYTVFIGPSTQTAFRILRLTPVRETTTEPV